jgi:hypothetical protein
MDSRNRYLRPRTRQTENELYQPIGSSGRDPAQIVPAARVQEIPLDSFPAETVVGASVVAQIPLPNFCTGFRLVTLSGTVYCSINGGGPRVCLDNDLVSGANIRSLQISTGAASGCTVQTFGCQNIPSVQA